VQSATTYLTKLIKPSKSEAAVDFGAFFNEQQDITCFVLLASYYLSEAAVDFG